MIDVYICAHKPTKEEIQMLLKSLKPAQKLPLLRDLQPELFPDQLICENYLDRLLKCYTTNFLTNRNIDEICGVTYITMNERLSEILYGITEILILNSKIVKKM